MKSSEPQLKFAMAVARLFLRMSDVVVYLLFVVSAALILLGHGAWAGVPLLHIGVKIGIFMGYHLRRLEKGESE